MMDMRTAGSVRSRRHASRTGRLQRCSLSQRFPLYVIFSVWSVSSEMISMS